ncbi:MAG: ATP-dependent Clp protease ATP-binding subunit, partial [Streptococcus sp.]
KAFDLIDEAATICSTNGLSHVGKQEIAEVLKNKTGIPVTTILKGDKERLDGLKEKLSRRVKGQDEAVDAVVNAITVAQAGLQDQRKPLSSFMFLGTSGVGKTELALALAEGMFDDEEAIIRFDMSEYKQKGDITKLIGDRQTRTKGQLTEKVKQKPYSVILIDEVEKAHSEVVDLFLQVLDAGRLTDSTGRQVSFKNTIVIITTNIGSQKIIKQYELKGNFKKLTDRDKIQFEKSMTLELETKFRPEFLNRIEYKLIFNMLDEEVNKEIIVKQLSEIQERMKNKKLTLSYEESLVTYLLDVGTNIKDGARPLERVIKHKVLPLISKEFLNLSDFNQEYHFHLWVEGDAPDEHHREDKREILFEVEAKNKSFGEVLFS